MPLMQAEANQFNPFIYESMNSLANFSSVAGTWAVSGDVTQQTATNSDAYLRSATEDGRAIMGVSVRMRADSVPAGGTRRMGFILGGSSANYSSATVVFLETTNGGSSWNLKVDIGGTGNLFSISATHTTGTWCTLGAVAVMGGTLALDVWLDGQFKKHTRYNGAGANGDYIGLSSYNMATSFQHLRAWSVGPGHYTLF